MIPAPAGLVALRQLDLEEGEDAILVSSRVVCLTSVDGGPVAWVVGPDSDLCRADELEGYVGLDWREPVVAAVGSWGWQVQTEQGRSDIGAWLVKTNGHLAAVVVDDEGSLIVDPDEDECRFIRAPDNDDPAE